MSRLTAFTRRVITSTCSCTTAWLACVVVLLASQTTLSTARAQLPRNVPNAIYFQTKAALHAGDFNDTYAAMLQETNGSALKFVAGRWVDSICYFAMAGEAAFQAGQHKKSLDAFSMALDVYLQNPNWLQSARMDVPPLNPLPPGNARRINWGQSARRRMLAQYPETWMISFGENNIGNVLAKGGGVVVQPMLLPAHCDEIAFCTAWSIKRRRELLGPLSQHDNKHSELLTVLSRRPGQPNHWTESWISVQLGLAFSAMGKEAQAKTELERGILAAGKFDHALTGLALLELGRIAADADDADTSLSLYAEASYAAAQFDQPLVLEESFRNGFNIFMRAGKKGMFPPLDAALRWCNSNNTGGELNWLQTSLQTMAAENAMLIGQTKIASDMLTKARVGVTTTGTRSGMAVSKPGAQYQFVLAMSSYYQAQTTAGDQALAKLMDFQRNNSLRLFQIAYVDSLRTSPVPLQARIAIDVYNTLLRDPGPGDWTTEPREALSVMSIPHSISYENWFEVALERKEIEKAFEISERCRRHRFLSAQPLGGRLLNLQWLLESPPESLDRAAVIQRQDLLTRFPQYAQAAEQARRVHGELTRLPLVAESPADVTAQKKKVDELTGYSNTQELLLRYIGVRREPADLVFPPLRAAKDIQSSLAPGTGVLAYFSTAQKTHVFFITNERYGHSELKNPPLIKKTLESLLQAWALFDANKTMRLDELADTKWRKPASELYQQVMSDVRVDSRPMQELIIVPDQILWYVPFEALQVTQGDSTVPLIQLTRLRYSPTVSLAVGDTRPRRKPGPMGVVLSKLFPREPDEQSELAMADLTRAVPESIAIRGPLVPQANVYSTLFDRLAIFSDLQPAEGDALAWAPVPLAAKGPGANLASWLELPWGGPDQIYLPGFRTPAENSFRKAGSTSGATISVDGQELFMSICGMMATGTRTVLISRWRPGGRSSYDLVREFAQEVPYSSASAAWQRAVRLVSTAPIDPSLEPRVATGTNAEPIKADHPFFWAGFILADTGSMPVDAGTADGVIKVKKDDAKPDEPKKDDTPKKEEPKPATPEAKTEPPKAAAPAKKAVPKK
jgi:hypothetical protein